MSKSVVGDCCCKLRKCKHEENRTRISYPRVTESSGNVFVDRGFDEVDAKVVELRVELILQLRKTLNQRGLTHAEAAKQLGVRQPRVSALLN